MDPSLYPFGTYVPSQVPVFPKTLLKHLPATPHDPPPLPLLSDTESGSNETTGTGTVGEGCSMCDLCSATLTGKAGFVICVDGNPIFVNDYPNSGGPWVPAFLGNGQLVWVNGGGL